MKTTFSMILSAVLLLLAQLVSAEIYRWTDDQGHVQYSQTPPPDGRDVKSIAPAPAPSEAQKVDARKRYQKEDQELSDEELAAEQDQESKKLSPDDLAAREKLCEIARKNLEVMENRPRNTLFKIENKTENTEEFKRYTNEEWETEHKKYQDAVDRNCGD